MSSDNQSQTTLSTDQRRALFMLVTDGRNISRTTGEALVRRGLARRAVIGYALTERGALLVKELRYAGR